jgi:DNA modification methylase
MSNTSALHVNGIAVAYRPRASLTPHASNPNSHSPKQVERIARSIRDYGWTNPIIVDENGGVLAGHGRLLAAATLGIEEVPTICLGHMTPAQKRAYIIADNRLSEVGGTWDRQLLALEHGAIRLLDPEFDLTATGFDDDDIEIMFDTLQEVGADTMVEVDRSRPATARVGDLWRLGRHRLYCGNALEAASYTALLGTEKAQLVIVDAPYNVPIGGHCVGKGKHREFVMASGEMTRPQFAHFLKTAFDHLRAFSQDGSIHFLFMDHRHMAEMVLATSDYTEHKNLVVWDKQSAGMGSFYRSQHELVWVMKNGTARHINNFGLGEKGRHRSNVWSYQGLNGGGAERSELLALHPTVKPVALISDAIKDCSKRDGLVLDCFAGSGTILIAAERTGRRAAAMELDPHYVDTAIERWQAETGKKATIDATGATFAQVRKERSDD